MTVLSLGESVDGFIKYLKAERGCSSSTAQEYRRDLRLLGDYISESGKRKGCTPDNIDVEEIESSDIASFLAHAVIEEDNSLSTRNRKLYALRSFYSYLNKRGLTSQNPARNIEPAKTKIKAEPEHLSAAEVKRLIKAVCSSNGRTQERDEAIIKTFVYCGLRVSELVNLNIDNVDFEEPSIKFYGKGSRERCVPIHPEALEAIEKYIAQREQGHDDASGPLFLSSWNRRISVRTVQLLVKKYAEQAGLKNASEVNPNKLRHTFASLFYGKTKDIKILQELLGHSSLTTTQIYTHTDHEQHQKAIGELPEF